MDLSDPTLAEFFLPTYIKPADVFQIHTARSASSFIARGREWQRCCEERRVRAIDRRSAQEIASCAAKPAISPLASRRKFAKPVSQRLSDDAARRRIDRELAARISRSAKLSEEMSECTFQPLITSDFPVDEASTYFRHRSHLAQPLTFHPLVNRISPSMRRAAEYTNKPVFARLSGSAETGENDHTTLQEDAFTGVSGGRLNLRALAARLSTNGSDCQLPPFDDLLTDSFVVRPTSSSCLPTKLTTARLMGDECPVVRGPDYGKLYLQYRKSLAAISKEGFASSN